MSHFIQPSTLTPDDVQKDIRKFVGDGTAYLSTPGLKNLQAIWMSTPQGRVAFPLQENRHRVDAVLGTAFQLGVDHEELFQVQNPGKPDAILLRNIISNDGLWQNGVTWFIQGEFEEHGPEKEEESVQRMPKPRGRGS